MKSFHIIAYNLVLFLGSFFLYTLVSTDIDPVVFEAMKSQASHLWSIISVLCISASMMAVSSIFFAIGKRSTRDETSPLFSPV